MIDWTNKAARERVIQRVNSDSEKRRKERSKFNCDIYTDNIEPHVRSELCRIFNESTTNEMPLVDTVNWCKRIINDSAKLYRNEIERSLPEAEDSQTEPFNALYEDGNYSHKLLKAHRYLKLEKQVLLQVIPKNKKIDLRIYKNYQYSVIEMDNDSTKAQAIIISSFDYNYYGSRYRDNMNEEKLKKLRRESQRYLVWSDEYSFIMNGNAEIVEQEETRNPIGIMPFVELSVDKDFCYFIDYANDSARFTVQYNASLSSQSQTVKMQGYSQPVLKGDPKLREQNLELGPTKVLFLESSLGGENSASFEFVNTGADLSGNKEHNDKLLNDFLASKGLDAESFIKGGKMFSSGAERLLSMVSEYEESKEDIPMFKMAEKKIFEIIKKWMNVLGDSQLDSKYRIPNAENLELIVDFKKPEMTTTTKERIEESNMLVAAGLMDKVGQLAYIKQVTREEAERLLEEINGASDSSQERRDQSDIEPRQNI